MRRAGLATAFLFVAALAARAGDEGAPAAAPPAPPSSAPGVVLAAAGEDVDGSLRLDDAVAQALLVGGGGRAADPVAAAHAWMDLAERAPDGRLPAPAEAAAPESPKPFDGLWWPVAEVVFARLATLPAAGRAAVERRWGPRARERLDVARAGGDPAVLADVVRRFGATEAGAQALLALADLADAEGRAADAVRALDAWMRWHPEAPPSRRAAVAARMLDACVAAHDERGIPLVARRAAALASVVVPGGGGAPAEPLEAAIARALGRVRGDLAAAAEAEPVGPAPSARLATLWSRSLVDAALLRPSTEAVLPPLAAVAIGDAVGGAVGDADRGADGALYVVEERVARRLDVATGVTRWTYPAPPPAAREVTTQATHEPWEGAVRAAVPARDLVLVVLGEPACTPTSMYERRNRPRRQAELARETRARLVALAAADGTPRWSTGAFDDADPVLRASGVSVAAAPTVVGDRVYVVLSARDADVVSWLACLDLATGRPRFMTPLSRGESGLVRDREDARALYEARVRSVPRALPPAVAAGEVCVVPGAGYAAGVDADDGRVRWIRTLPRYVYEDRDEADVPPAERAHDARVAPVAAFGAWYVAAPDAPVPVAIELGTGRLRFCAQVRPQADDDRADARVRAPDAQVLLGAVGRADGRAVLRLAGSGVALDQRDAATGAIRDLVGLAAWPDRPVGGGAAVPAAPSARGRPWAEGRRVVVARAGGLASGLWPARGEGAPREDGKPVRPVDGAPVPDGDVLRLGDRWLVVGAERLVMLADPARERARPASDAEPRRRAARACQDATAPGLAAAARLDALRAAARAVAALSPRDADVDARCAAAVDAWLDARDGPLASATPERALAETVVLGALAREARAAAYLRIARAALAHRRHAALVDLVDVWVGEGPGALVDVDAEARVSIRGDLYAAAALLPAAGETPEGEDALRRREARAADALAAARARGPDALAAVVARFPGTAAAWAARARLVGDAVDRGEGERVAATAADLRTARIGPLWTGSVTAAALRALEAEACERVGDRDAARAALGDAAAAAPAAARRSDGACGATLDAILRRATAFVPVDVSPDALEAVDVPLWGAAGAPTKAALLDATALTPSGPGATEALSRVVVARGDALGVLDLEHPDAWRAVAAEDAGYVGARFADLEPAAPSRGIVVAHVVPAGPADRAGIRVGDVVVAVDGVAVGSRAALARATAAAAGRTLAVDLVRDGRRLRAAIATGERTEAERDASAFAHAWVDRDGTWVVPARLGLRAVDPTSGRATTRWHHDGPGVVQDLVVVRGTVIVWTADGPLRDGVVVAVDPASGRERWRTRLPAEVRGVPRGVGSALLVDTQDEDRTWVLDLATGDVRASHRRADPEADLQPAAVAALAPPPTAIAAGSVHLVRDGAARNTAWLVGVDPATGWPTWSRIVEEPHAFLRPRLLAGGGLVAFAASIDEIRLLRPDLTGRAWDEDTLALDGLHFELRGWGSLDSDSRLAVAGDVVHLIRTSRDRRASVGSLLLDRRAARVPPTRDPVVWAPAQRIDVGASALPDDERRTLWPYATGADATPDGVWVRVVWLEDGDRVVEGCAAWWEPQDDGRRVLVPLATTLFYPQPPVRIGRRVLFRTDAGFRMVPLREAPAR